MLSVRLSLRGAAALALVLVPSLATAQNQQRAQPRGGIEFPQCDGFGPVMRGGDGMSVAVGGFWVPKSDRVRRPPELGKWVDSCSAAIALIDRAYPTFQLRKISLLQSRAAHKLAAKDVDGALEDLNAADAVLPNSTDELYLRSLAVNTDLIRLSALVDKGRVGEAEAIARKIVARRPYVRTIFASIFYAFGSNGSQAFNDEMLEALARYHPNAAGDQFIYRFETGRYEQALAVFDSVARMRFIQQTVGGQREIDQTTEDARERAAAFQFLTMCRRAYALAALQRNDEAEAALKQAQDFLALELTDPPAPGPTAPKGEAIRSVVVQQANLRLKTGIRPFQTAWDNIIRARLAANKGSKTIAVELLSDPASHMPGSAFTDAWRAAGLSRESDPRGPISVESAALLSGLEKRSLDDLFTVLLDAETPARVNERVPALSRAFMSGDAAARGGCAEKAPSGNVDHACFAGYDATLAVTEERALLRAAWKSLADQKPYFVVTKRDDVRSSVTTVTYGVRGPEQQLGFSTTLEFEKRASNENCVRCIDAEKVKLALEPVYGAPAPTPSRPR